MWNGQDITIDYKPLCQGGGGRELGLGEGYSCKTYM